MTNKERLCKTCIYGDKIEYDKPCVVYSDKCELYEQKKPMTNEEAINTLKVILKEATETEDSISYVTSVDADALKAAIQALEQMESSLEKPNKSEILTGWIPVSERLPKAGEYIGNVAKYYLVQNEYGDMMIATFTHSEYWEQIYQLKPIADKIIAWMPLPEPYRK